MMQLFYRLAADAVVILHAGYAAFIVVGMILIVLGPLLRWPWIRNVWFRLCHLLAIAIVVIEGWLGITCPLTSLEKWLLVQAGQARYEGDFIANLVHELLFYQAPSWIFAVCYLLIGLVILSTLFWVPPYWPYRSNRFLFPRSWIR